MHSLTCQATDCMYNAQGKCSANMIQVSNSSRETFCDTYIKDDSFVAAGKKNTESGAFTNSVSDTEFGSEFVSSPRISCTATQCAYNKSFHCKADGVEIDNPHDTMICHCNTFKQK